jgi:hypothetical protein
MIPVEGHKNLYRDEHSGAIINCDSFGYSQYMRIKNEKKKQRDEIDQIKNDIDEIKSLLKEIINGSQRN